MKVRAGAVSRGTLVDTATDQYAREKEKEELKKIQEQVASDCLYKFQCRS